jgi:hypothetical protein
VRGGLEQFTFLCSGLRSYRWHLADALRLWRLEATNTEKSKLI